MFRSLVMLAGILALWLSAMLGAMLFTNVAPAALVIAPSSQFVSSLPSTVQMMRGGDWSMVVTSSKENYALDLYKAGALLVFPALQNGCLALTPKKQSPSQKVAPRTVSNAGNK